MINRYFGSKEKMKVVLVFLFFTFTMTFHLMHSPMWGDEWVEYDFSQASILTGELYQRIIFTFQPPLYNFIMHFWLMCNQSLLWFRMFNVLIGIGSGFYLYRSLKSLYNLKVANVVLICLAVCYRWVYCVQECSEYGLMLFFLFGALFYYIEVGSQFTWRKVIVFLIFSIGAIYSQYGAVFVIMPLLLLFYSANMFGKNVSNERKIGISVLYFVSFAIFAIPLYVFFLRIQLKSNGMGSNIIPFGLEMCKDMPFIFGRLIGYFLSLNNGEVWDLIWGTFSIGIIICSIYILKYHWTDKIKKNLLSIFWITYILHYFSVKLHIYAMHANASAGFFERYSLFYIPIVCIILPIVFCEVWEIKSIFDVKSIMKVAAGAGILCLTMSYYYMIGNWTKATDNQFAEIWMTNRGWEDTTYVIGPASHSFKYYISHAEGYQEGYLDNARYSVDTENMPARFWLWKLSWGNDYELGITYAEKKGYSIVDYSVPESSDKLTFCYLENIESEN